MDLPHPRSGAARQLYSRSPAPSSCSSSPAATEACQAQLRRGAAEPSSTRSQRDAVIRDGHEVRIPIVDRPSRTPSIVRPASGHRFTNGDLRHRRFLLPANRPWRPGQATPSPRHRHRRRRSSCGRASRRRHRPSQIVDWSPTPRTAGAVHRLADRSPGCAGRHRARHATPGLRCGDHRHRAHRRCGGLIIVCPCAFGLARRCSSGRARCCRILTGAGSSINRWSIRLAATRLEPSTGRTALVDAAMVDGAVTRCSASRCSSHRASIAQAIAAAPPRVGPCHRSRISPTSKVSACKNRRRHAAAGRSASTTGQAPPELARRQGDR
jgi:hypothetical protein